jgi:hypothetical protein
MAHVIIEHYDQTLQWVAGLPHCSHSMLVLQTQGRAAPTRVWGGEQAEGARARWLVALAVILYDCLMQRLLDTSPCAAGLCAAGLSHQLR